MLSDAHAHLNDKAFDNDIMSVYEDCLNKGVGIIVNSAWDRASSEKALELAEKYDNMYFTVGIHPHNAIEAKENDLYALIELSRHNKCVAWGEVGLDYHYDFSPRDMQKGFFGDQIAIANELSLPLVLHLREAYQDANEILDKNIDKLNNGVLLHCYSGSMELARDYYNKFGCYYSFGGAITFNKNNKKSVLEVIPKDRLLLETDCPYMTPVPFRGERNTPALLGLVRDRMACDLGLTAVEVENLTYQNIQRFYRLGEK